MNIEQARFNMIEQQIRPWDVLDQDVLNLLSIVKRENFVPAAYRNIAFADLEIPLPGGERMLSPKVEARVLQELAITKHETVLEIGAGSGYMAALLAARGRSRDDRRDLRRNSPRSRSRIWRRTACRTRTSSPATARSAGRKARLRRDLRVGRPAGHAAGISRTVEDRRPDRGVRRRRAGHEGADHHARRRKAVPRRPISSKRLSRR